MGTDGAGAVRRGTEESSAGARAGVSRGSQWRATGRAAALAALGLLLSGALPAASARAARVAPAPSASASAGIAFDPARMMRVDDVRPGMRGVARTVFQGTRIEEFPVEVVSVMRHASSDGDIVLVRCLGERLEHTGIAAGMSGSPVYIDGKLLGAIALGWPFSKDPIAGVTPIEQMLTSTHVTDAARRTELDPEPQAAGERMAPVPLLVGLSGGSPILGELADSLLPSLGMAAVASPARGRATAAEVAADSLVPGAAVGVSLVQGDLDLTAVGTVTDRVGDQVIAFGHPLFGAGSVSLPLTTAYVHTILSSQLSSSKMASVGRVVGALEEDRNYAIRGTLGDRANVIPVTLEVTDDTGLRREFHYGVMRHHSFTPTFAAMAIADGIADASGGLPRVALPYQAEIRFAGGRKWTWQDQPVSAAGTQPALEMARDLASRLNLLMNNTWSDVGVDSIRVVARVEPGVHAAQLENAWLLKARVHPGETVPLMVRVRPDRRPAYTRTLSLALPAHMPPGRYRVLVSDVDTRLDAEKSRAPGIFRANSLDQALDVLRLKGSRAAVYATVYSDDVGASARGQELPGLPGGALAVLDNGRLEGGVQWVRARRWVEVVQPLPDALSGSLELELNVESEAH